MIGGIFHQGSGLGDQLFRYITVRTIAEKKQTEWGMLGWDNFKGDSFLNIDKGKPLFGSFVSWNEKYVRDHNGNDIRSYDPEINFIKYNTIIDGSFEDDKYWRHNLDNISKWLSVEKIDIPESLCVIGFRGGEYASVPELFLTKEYYEGAIRKMRQLNPNMRFQVHTDDPKLALTYFPDFSIVENTPISHSKHTNMGLNWRSARYAKYAIIPNSAFFIMPRILRHHDGDAITIAPRYWAGRNVRIWKRPACYYREFLYI